MLHDVCVCVRLPDLRTNSYGHKMLVTLSSLTGQDPRDELSSSGQALAQALSSSYSVTVT